MYKITVGTVLTTDLLVPTASRCAVFGALVHKTIFVLLDLADL